MLGSDAVPIITSWDKGKKFLKLENKRVGGGIEETVLGFNRCLIMHLPSGFTQSMPTHKHC